VAQQPSVRRQDHHPPADPIVAGNAPCSWGIMGGFELPSPPTYLDVLDGIAGSGYNGTELGDWGFMPDDPVALARELTARGLSIIGAFTPVALTDPPLHPTAERVALRTARLLAACPYPPGLPPTIVLADDATARLERRRLAGRVRAADALSDTQVSALAAGANRIARRVLDETGVRTAFHPHCGTCIETLEETHSLFDLLDPELVGFCYDTGHVAYARDDPIDVLREFAPRIHLVHFKDYRPEIAERARREEWDHRTAVANGLFCEVSAGAIDFAGVLAVLRAAGYAGWIVVEDELPPGSGVPLESARRDRAFLRSLGI